MKQMNNMKAMEMEYNQRHIENYHMQGYNNRDGRMPPPLPIRREHQKQATVQLHSCCMMTCTLNGGPDHHGDIHRQKPGRKKVIVPCVPPQPQSPPERLFGMKASDIDKYSRIVFPITFLSFHLMYWMIYLTISNDVVDDLVYLELE